MATRSHIATATALLVAIAGLCTSRPSNGHSVSITPSTYAAADSVLAAPTNTCPTVDDALVSNPAELQKCLAACKTGGATILRYCGTMPTPQLRALCYAAAAAGAVSFMGFCYARFVD